VTHGGVPVVEPIFLGFVYKSEDGEGSHNPKWDAAMSPSLSAHSLRCLLPTGEWEAPDIPTLDPQSEQPAEDAPMEDAK
jgi:hypothetical protein